MISDPVLVLVDMQNDFCKPGFAYVDESEPGIQRALENAGEFLDRYRSTGRRPILVRTHHSESTTSPVWNRKYERSNVQMPCQPDTPGAAFVEELDVSDDDVVVTKHRYSAFFNSMLETVLSANGVSHLLIGGVNTEICVSSTVHGAFNRDYEVTVLADCCGSPDAEQHQANLDLFESTFGEVRQSSDVELSDVS